MAAIFITLPANYDEKDLSQWLESHSLTHLRNQNHTERLIKVHDRLRTHDGKEARVMSTTRDRADNPMILIANKDMTKEELGEAFDSII